MGEVLCASGRRGIWRVAVYTVSMLRSSTHPRHRNFLFDKVEGGRAVYCRWDPLDDDDDDDGR